MIVIGLSSTSASAQLITTVTSTATFSGKVELPSINPNFNQSISRVDTDKTGAYYRKIGTKSTFVYKSNYVKSSTSSGVVKYYVDFKGIPIVSANGQINSPVLSGGQLTSYKYQGRLPTNFQGVVQDEFNFNKAYYTGIVTDPQTKKKCSGTFEVYGYGPRYSDPNGSTTPTIFSFKSDLPGSPTIKSLTVTNAPLPKFYVKVPTKTAGVFCAK
jgi:hypothetical protein